MYQESRRQRPKSVSVSLTTAEEGALIALSVVVLGLLLLGALWGLWALLEYAFSAN